MGHWRDVPLELLAESALYLNLFDIITLIRVVCKPWNQYTLRPAFFYEPLWAKG